LAAPLDDTKELSVSCFRCSAACIAAAAATLIPASQLCAVPILNLAQTFDPIKTKLSAGQTVNIVTMGDSITFNWQSWQPVFTQKMATQYGSAGAGYRGIIGGPAPWTSGSIGGDPVPHQSLDGLWSSTPGSAVESAPGLEYHADASFGPQAAEAPTNLDIHYLGQPGGGSVHATIYDPASQPLGTVDLSTASDTQKVLSYTYHGAAASWVRFQSNGDGPVTLLGTNRRGDAPGVRVHMVANGGWGIDNFLQRDSTFDGQLPLLEPDLITLWVGQNDSGTRTDYADRIQQEVTRLQADAPNAKILLIGSYDTGSTKFVDLNGAMGDVAAADGLGFINLYETAGSNDFLVNQGWIGDGVHLSPAGGEHFGDMLFQAFQTDGANLVPEPGTGALVLVGGLALLRRRRRASLAQG
jgi:lysophospholipase L1-like esterase